MSTINSGGVPKWLPSIGMTGFYTLSSPYTGLVSPTTQYRCDGVLSLKALLAQGEDPLSDIYLANGDTKTSYQSDLDNNVSIVTLTAGETVIRFPSSALTQLPNQNGVVYRNTLLGIALSAIPDYLDLTDLQNQISAMILDTLGVRSSTMLTTIGNATVLTYEQDQRVQSARNAMKNNHGSALYQISQLQSQVLALQQEIAAYQSYILENAPPPTVTG